MDAAPFADVPTQIADKPPLTQLVGGRRRADVQRARDGITSKRFIKQLARDLQADQLTNLGAMMAYYAVLALFPMLVFIVTLAMLVLDSSTIQQGVAMATSTMPRSTRELIATHVQSFVDTAGAGFAIGSAALALWGASRGALALSGALNAMFDKQETRPWWNRQLTAIVVTFAVAVVVVLALALLVIGPLAGHWAADRFGLGDAFDVAWSIGRWIGAGLLVIVLWAVVYKFLPNTDAPFRIFTPGAIIGVLAWLGVSYLFGLFLRNFGNYEATYGALATVIIFLTWLWLSNVALLFGAEINDVLADLRKDRSTAAAQLADANEGGSDAK